MSAIDQVLFSKGKSSGRAKGRGTFTNRDSRRTAPYETGGQKTSILDRLGDQAAAKPLRASGTSVTIGNLNSDITAHDISELCATVGGVKSVMMQFDSAGNSTGTAEVVFDRRSEAMTCVSKFDKVNLDSSPMSVSLTEDIGRSHSDSISNYSTSATGAGSNIREGLFGTAIKSNEFKQAGGAGGGGYGKKTAGGADTIFSVRLNDGPPVATKVTSGKASNSNKNEPTFSVTVTNKGGNGGKQGGGARGNEGNNGRSNNRDRNSDSGAGNPAYFLHDDREGSQQHSGGNRDAGDRWVRGGGERRDNNNNNNNNNRQGGGGGGFKGGRGGGRGGAGGNGGRREKKEPSAASGMDLDDDLDSYFKKR